jgi:hypothetical protein
MKNSYVDVGYWGPGLHKDSTETMTTIATTHEFGDRSRHIPERSFLRSTVDKKTKAYEAEKRRLSEGIIEGRFSTEAALTGMGERIVSDVQTTISGGIPPPLADRTIEQRRHGGATPLIDTGALRASIQTRIFLNNKKVNGS